MARRWTDEEKAIVIDGWGVLSVRCLAKRIGRTKQAVITFAERNKLGGCVLNSGVHLTTSEVGEMLGVDCTTVIYWIKKGWLKSERKTLRKRRVNRVDVEDLREFMKDNPERWNACDIKDDILMFDEQWFKDKMAKDRDKVERDRGKAWTVLEEKRLVELVMQGYTNPEIAKMMDRTYFSIKRKRPAVMKKVGAYNEAC